MCPAEKPYTLNGKKWDVQDSDLFLGKSFQFPCSRLGKVLEYPKSR